MNHQIYRFGAKTDGDASMKNLLGGKGANLAEMAKLHVRVPNGYTLSTDLCIAHQADAADPMAMTLELRALILQGDIYVTEVDAQLPPLVSVRSGARVSMPGMMDTILNVGITSSNVEAWGAKIGRRAALDCRRRFIQMFATVALNLPMEWFDAVLNNVKTMTEADSDADLSESALTSIITDYLSVIEGQGFKVPDSRIEQIHECVKAVFRSWDNERAEAYRIEHGIPYAWGTAATVQSMVFGNLNDKSATGVTFTRDPSTGENCPFGDWLANAQGEDVVAGIRPVQNIAMLEAWSPAVADELLKTCTTLERHFKDMQDIEWTVQDGAFFVLQTRNGMRSAAARIKIAHDLADEGLIDTDTALSRIDAATVYASMSVSVQPGFDIEPHLKGTAAGGGVVSGVVVLTALAAVHSSVPCILVTHETSPDDFQGMARSVGILTATGGLTSHAAVVARGMGKSCVVGAHMQFLDDGFVHAGGWKFKEGQKITIDGATGAVWIEVNVPLTDGEAPPEARIMARKAAKSSYAERLTLTGEMSGSDIAKAVASLTAKTVFLDMAGLEWGVQPILDLHECEVAFSVLRSVVAGVGVLLNDHPIVKRAVVDRKPLAAYMPDTEHVFDKMFGQPTSTPTLWVDDGLNAWPDEMKAKTALTSGFGAHLDGFQKFKRVKNFADLLASDNLIEMGQGAEQAFGGIEAFTKACELVNAAHGKQLRTVSPAYWYSILGAKK